MDVLSISKLSIQEAASFFDALCFRAAQDGLLLHEFDPVLNTVFVQYFGRWHKNLVAAA